jgi:hypothetical protein
LANNLFHVVWEVGKKPLSALRYSLLWLWFITTHKRGFAYFKKWYRSIIQARQPLDDEVPWYTYFTIEWLNEHLQPHMRVFEWGCGGSTVYFAKRVEQVVSIENDPVWHERILEALQERDLPNVDLRLVPIQDDPGSHDSPFFFHDYIHAIDDFEDHYFDLIAIDGWEKNPCTEQAIPKIRSGGVILVDIFAKSTWDEILPLFDPSEWKMVSFKGPIGYTMQPFSFTTIFIKLG